MVFPSRGCITCKTRRIKCDSVHPICGRCQKASRDCAWDQNEAAGLLFKSENAFAQGKPRRPWKPREREEDAIVAIPSEIVPENHVSLSSLEDYDASHFWLENYVFRDDEIPEFAREYSHYLVFYRNRAQPSSSLRLVMSAFSYALSGRAMREDKAIEKASDLFAQGIAKMQAELSELSQDNIDELIVTTMLMASYENVMYRDARHRTENNMYRGMGHRTREGVALPPSIPNVTGSEFWKDVCHHKGAAGLLKLRQQHGWTPNLALDRAVRRQLIRTCILRGIPAGGWFHDGAYFGEEGPVLSLDSIVVRVATLRSNSLPLFLPKSRRFVSELRPADIVAEARDLDTDLESWSRTIPADWKFSIESCPEPGAAFDGLTHVYATHGHGTVWNRYRATRLIVSSIRRRALAVMAQCSSMGTSTNAEQDVCLEKIGSLSRDLCRSVPFFLTSPVNPAQDNGFSRVVNIGGKEVYTNEEILPKLATLLAWPLTLAISTDGVPEPQKQWLKQQLKSISSALGDAVLEILTEDNEDSEFQF
ncbi:hypothetical protein Hte_009650 [Hypoxylon texense]